MPTLPWTTPATPPAGAEVHVFASRFETRTLWGALRFFLRTPTIWRQVGRAPGAYGATLRAAPFRRTFWTLSAWESPRALKDFAASAPHGPMAAGLRGAMKDARFVSWKAAAEDLPLDWEDALGRLA
ncbi:DUF3291 domain-containing protein [Streptomyces sp. VRA16 Mangrove soil]|uniref:DUF3291 domain-containing protein n=1 Tax=Streptomyces sp. VRA16 Mangrove soil TaxID=2817434 RepID=UPI001A9F4210|nr:DUF3291 domain-containing protein [Streptomyces sp. VRA16 Mangrove soil]MBO1334981.1 DUF3291 domain-containing protein [Streptomyces sp. VRA16 Mangrove soil]